MQTDGDKPHRRRPHYSGKYPRKYSEKYKELQPEKYTEIIEHIKAKGQTPAGMHVPICVKEILEILKIQKGEQGLDCTLGYGGHASEILKVLDHTGRLIGLDVDPIESVKTGERIRAMGYGISEFEVCLTNFADIDEVCGKFGKFDFVLADLGVSSMQIDDPERGFSFREDGPLDLRLDPSHGTPASMRLKEMSKAEIEGMLIRNADEEHAAEIAKAMYTANHKGGIGTTGQLYEIIKMALSKLPREEREEAVRKSCRRCFQAIRIDVNREFEVLEELMKKLPEVLNPGGRAAILTFHSGEDRIVKKMFRMYHEDGIYSDISGEVIRPGAEECYNNPRARSAKLRWAVRA